MALAARSPDASELDVAMRAMEQSFHVRLISTFGDDLVCAPASADSGEWVRVNGMDFDQFPVKAGAETIGVLLRSHAASGAIVREVMLPLREGLVVSAEMPITSLIPTLGASHYRLVLRGASVDGLVTRSDLARLPVRLVLFALLTHLEQTMARTILRLDPAGRWLDRLPCGRREKIQAKERVLQARRLNPARIELTEWCDKRDLCATYLEAATRKLFVQDLRELQHLRDRIAHASDFAPASEGQQAVGALVKAFESARRWITDLPQKASERGRE